MIVVSGGSRVLFACKHVIALPIKRKDLARAHRPSNSMRFKHQDMGAHGSAEEAHPKIQTDASDRSLSRHVSHPSKKEDPVEVPNLLLFSRRCGRIRWLSVGVDRVGLWKVLIEIRVLLIFWNCWNLLHTMKLQVFFDPCLRDMTEHILIIFLSLHEVQSDYALTWVCGRTITVMLLHLRTAVVLAFSLTTL